MMFLPGAAAGGALSALLRRLPAESADWEGGGPGSIHPLPAVLSVGFLWVLITAKSGFTAAAGLDCLLVLPLAGLALYDIATGIIPPQLNLAVFVLGATRAAMDIKMGGLASHLVGLIAVAGPLWLIYLISRGRAIG
ncbi:MAG TPA: hypothetical protein VN446_09610, partial [Candidatus Acidoferrum sp.]|nr:hypothetical protein [Candidatus Acidoferrum sp.]